MPKIDIIVTKYNNNEQSNQKKIINNPEKASNVSS